MLWLAYRLNSDPSYKVVTKVKKPKPKGRKRTFRIKTVHKTDFYGKRKPKRFTGKELDELYKQCKAYHETVVRGARA
jgi:hypothetical protein